MKLPIYQVDAFADRVFGGNPAAVVLLEEWLPDDRLLAIAAENNLSETAFVIPRADVSPLRWFTPAVEVDLCGHATLAAAHVLFHHRFPSLKQVTFSTRSGQLTVSQDGDLIFAPRAGVPEDPVTGSAHCTLVPYWAARLGKPKLVAKQLSARGGDLVCELRGDRVMIAGHAVEYLCGEINIPA